MSNNQQPSTTTTLSHQLNDDMCFEVMQFLDKHDVIHQCFPVSKQWYRVASTKIMFPITLKQSHQFEHLLTDLKAIVSSLEPSTSTIADESIVEKFTFPYSRIDELDLSSPLITTKAEHLSLIRRNFINLKKIKLGGNFLSDDECLELVKEIGNMTSLTHLSLTSCKSTVETVQALTSSQLSHNLQSLSMPFCSLTDECIEILCSSMSHLTELTLDGNHNGIESVKSVCNHMQNLKTLNFAVLPNYIRNDVSKLISSSLKQLTSLDVSNCPLGSWGCKEFSSSLTHLTTFNAKYANIDAEGAKYLSQLKNLTELNIHKNELGPEGAKYIASMIQLKHLFIASNNIGVEGTKHLTTSLVNLKTLNINENGLGPEGAKLIGTSNLTGLTDLSISLNTIGDEGVQAIVGNNHLINLTTLNIENNGIGDEGFKSIGVAPLLHKLKLIRASDNNVGNEGLKAIANSSSLEELETLELLRNCSVSDEGARAIVDNRCQLLPKLKVLTLASDNITQETQQYCYKKMPKIWLEKDDDYGDWEAELENDQMEE